MKKIISLIISASIFLQIAAPTASIITYAQESESAYGFQWEESRGLDRTLETKDFVEGSKEALVSWQVDSQTNDYTLEYLVENTEVAEKAEKVRFTFNKDTDKKATAKIEILDLDGNPKEKKYRIFDFSSIGAEEDWIDKTESEIKIDIVGGTRYQGGRVKIGDLEIRFRWKDGKVHFQTNQIKHGYITPFSLKYGEAGVTEKINVLTGIEGYAVSPIHINVDETIKNKDVIIVPGEGEIPGSKPGIKIDFKRPKQWSETEADTPNKKGFVELNESEAKNIVATLELADLTDVATARLVFNIGKGSDITGLDQVGKKLSYNTATNIYSIYLAKDDVEHENIVKWEKLEPSMILKRVQLSLIKKQTDTSKAEALGSFSPQPESKGRHTYLGYTIKRSSMEEAFIEVQPYNGAKNTEYTYIVESAPNMEDGVGRWTELVEHKYTTTGQNEEKPFTIPIPFSSNFEDQYYRVTAKYNQITMKSQILQYQPNKDLTVPPPTPVIQSIDNIYVVPAKKLGDGPETIGFDLTWSAPKNSSQNKLLDRLLEQGNIYYEMFFHEDLESTETRGTLAKVFKVGLVGQGDQKKISVLPHGGTAGSEPEEVRYNPSKDTFTMENIVLKNLDKTNWEQIEIKNPGANNEYEKGSKYPEFVVTDNMPSKEVPGIYYITMKALYETTQAAITMGVSNKSNPKSITISPLEEVIPVPTKIESKHLPDENDSEVIRQSFSWNNINLDRYIKQMLAPLDLKVGEKGSGVYELYLYQKKNIKESEFIDIEPVASNLHTANTYTLKDEDIDALRKGDVIRLDYTGSSNTGMNNIILDGLDTNQVYYTRIKVRLDVKDKDGENVEQRYSLLSKEHSFTSYVEPSEPSPWERVPPVPEKLQIIDQPNNTTAKIGWEAPEYNRQEGEELYYEMMRLDARTLAKEEDSRLFSIKKLLGDDKKNEMAAWRTKEPLVRKYDKTSKTWVKAIPDQQSSKLQLEDPGLNPNMIYYYYVRTVLVIDGEEVYSSWIGLPVTTDPIQKPIQLKVEEKEAYSHDPKKEIVVSFLAPIPNGANVPGDYDFDIAIQGELDGDYRLDYSTTRITSKQDQKDIPTGYSHYVYRINNLKPGKRYDIKVRIIDKLVNKVNDQYPKSLYSDRVTTRTHFDQDEQDRDDKFEEYLKYFEDKVEALRRKPYWTLEDGSNLFSIKYRSNHIVPEINSTKTYKLDVREGVTDFTYHMPASVIASTNLNQTSFEITQGSVSYSIRPSTITTELEELKGALEDIKSKYIRDYYVTLNFSQRPSNIRTGLLTPEISVEIDLVRLREEDRLLEDNIMLALNEEINSEKVRFIEDLERALERGKILDEELEVLIDRSLAYIQKSHQKDVRNIVSRNTHKTVAINKWNKNMLIMAKIEGNAIAQGYLLGWQDTALTTFNTASGYGIETNQAGSYAFKGQKVNMPVIPGVGGAANLIAKYQLTDFFGIGGYINPSSHVSKRNVLGAMARVLGAPRGSDYNQYLKQMNIIGLSNIGMDLPIKKGEGIYLLMQVHEKTHKKPINTVYIKNRNALSNIRSFNQLHQPYVLVAVDSKIISVGSGIRPNDLMEIKDVLEVLNNIMATVR